MKRLLILFFALVLGISIYSLSKMNVVFAEDEITTTIEVETTTIDEENSDITEEPLNEDLKAKLEEAYNVIRDNVILIEKQKDEIKQTQTYQTIILVVGIFALIVELFFLLHKKILPKIKDMTASSKSIDENTNGMARLSNNLSVEMSDLTNGLNQRISGLTDELSKKYDELQVKLNESVEAYNKGIQEIERLSQEYDDVKDSVRLIAKQSKECVKEGITEEVVSILGGE